MKLRPSLQKRSIALGGLLAILGVAAVTLTPSSANAFVGVEVGPFAVGVGPTDPPPVVYTPPPVYTEPSVVYRSPSVTYYQTYTPTYSDYYYYPGYNVDLYAH